MSPVLTVAMWRRMHCCQTVRGPLTCTGRPDFGRAPVYGTVHGVVSLKADTSGVPFGFWDVFLGGYRIWAYFLLISTDDYSPCAKTLLA
jgi:hypothetical protein